VPLLEYSIGLNMPEGNEVDNVTFVGGKAIEQSEELESDTPASERSAAVEAVKKALSKARSEDADDGDDEPAPKKAPKNEKSKGKEKVEKSSKDDAPDSSPEASTKKPGDTTEKKRGSDGKFLPSKSSEKDADSEEESPDSEPLDIAKGSVKQLLKAREKVAKAHQEAQQINRQRAEFEEQTRAFQQQQVQLQRQQAQLQQEYQRLALLKSDPARAVRELGIEPEKFIVDLANEGTPQGQMARQMQAMQDQIAQFNAWQQQQAQAAQQAMQHQEEQRAQQYRGHIENQFLSRALDEETHPHIAHTYKGNTNALLAFGDLVAIEFRRLTGGREASIDEITDYIEDSLAENLKVLYSKKYGTKAGSGTTEKPKGSKGKSLSPEMSGERRALSSNSLRDLDDDERRRIAAERVAAAIADSE
jgi:hypothetical protein